LFGVTPSGGDVASLFNAVRHLCLPYQLPVTSSWVLTSLHMRGGVVKCDLALHVQEVNLFGLYLSPQEPVDFFDIISVFYAFS
jgi:hypothetical protein